MKNNKKIFLLTLASLLLVGCQKPTITTSSDPINTSESIPVTSESLTTTSEPESTSTRTPKKSSYVDTTAKSIYGRLSDFNIPSEEVKLGDVLSFKVTPSEDFFVEEVLNGSDPCIPVSMNEDGSMTFTTVIKEGVNRLKASYMVDANVDFVEKFKLNLSDEVFEEVMNPTTGYSDKKQGLDFRRCGVEQVGAPLQWSGNVKNNSGHFMNYVDGDTTHCETLNLGYTVKIRYLGIDTPESTSEIEKWGLTASYYSKYVYTGDASLKKYLDVVPEYAGITSLILVGQSASMNGEMMTKKDLKLGSNEQGAYYATADGNQRSLAYVWYATTPNPQKEDFRCLNLEMVYQGFSFGIGSIEDTGEYFYRYFDKANLSAKANGRHLYSDAIDDNYFDYENTEVSSLSMEKLYTSGTSSDSDIKYLPDSVFCNKKTLYKIKGFVSRKVGTSFYFQDKAEYSEQDIANGKVYGLYVFTYSETPIRVGDEVEVIGAVSSYGGCYQMQGVSYHTIDPDPNRDTKILSRGNKIVPIKVTGQQFNSIKYPQVLVEITDDLFAYNFTSVYNSVTSDLGEGGLQEINKYNEAYPFYNTSNSPIFYVSYGLDNGATMNASPASYGGSNSSGLRYSDSVIRFTVDQEILVSYGIDTCYSYRFFTGGNYLYNPRGAEYANLDQDNPYKDETYEVSFKRKKMSNVVVISTGYESTSGKRKMSAKICSGADLTLTEIDN